MSMVLKLTTIALTIYLWTVFVHSYGYTRGTHDGTRLQYKCPAGNVVRT